MATLTVPPAVGDRYRNQSTGRTWHVDRIADSGVVVLAEEFYGAECAVREYVTDAEIAEDYTPAD